MEPAQLDELKELRDQVSEAVYEDCDSIKDTMQQYLSLVNDLKDLHDRENELRDTVLSAPGDFDEKEVKKMLTSKRDTQYPPNPKYQQLVELIENARNGSVGDLVINEPQSQAANLKCPITQKPIKTAYKNGACDHVYERDAVYSYAKGKSNVKRSDIVIYHEIIYFYLSFYRCPVSGCPKMIILN